MIWFEKYDDNEITEAIDMIPDKLKKIRNLKYGNFIEDKYAMELPNLKWDCRF